MEHNFYQNIQDFNMCTDSEILKVEVPIIFFGTVGFSARRDARYRTSGPQEQEVNDLLAHP